MHGHKGLVIAIMSLWCGAPHPVDLDKPSTSRIPKSRQQRRSLRTLLHEISIAMTAHRHPTPRSHHATHLPTKPYEYSKKLDLLCSVSTLMGLLCYSTAQGMLMREVTSSSRGYVHEADTSTISSPSERVERSGSSEADGTTPALNDRDAGSGCGKMRRPRGPEAQPIWVGETLRPRLLR